MPCTDPTAITGRRTFRARHRAIWSAAVAGAGVLALAGCGHRAARTAAPTTPRPTELVSPAPQMNPKAAVWRTATPPAGAQAGDVWVNPKDGMQMVLVPAGEFLMGVVDDAAGATEYPQRRIYLDSYWIDKYAVTVAQYGKFCQATGRMMPPAPPWGWRDSHPMVNVSWYDAAAYAEWAGKRLPTEAEWEKAARGTDGRRFPWGDDFDPSRCANSKRQKLASTQPVGSYPADFSPYGCFDMAGNAAQWCADWVSDDSYRSLSSRNPQGPRAGQYRGIEGASWRDLGFGITGDFDNTPDSRNPYIGFRGALTAQ